MGGGVLIVNQQHKLEPYQRSPEVYTRPEFVAALTVPVISTRTLFVWWKVSDWRSIREAVLGPSPPADGMGALLPQAGQPPTPPAPTPQNRTRPWQIWRRKSSK
jgi:hypothetical protein